MFADGFQLTVFSTANLIVYLFLVTDCIIEHSRQRSLLLLAGTTDIEKGHACMHTKAWASTQAGMWSGAYKRPDEPE